MADYIIEDKKHKGDGCNKEWFTHLEETLPAVIARVDIPKYFSGLVTVGRMATLDCEGRGPKSFKLGRKVAYTRPDLIEWLRAMNEGGAA